MNYKTYSGSIDYPAIELGILDYWKKQDIFKKSVETKDKNNRFVFYEGPPTANGMPGVHHVISRTIKDLVCRYKTMKGFRVERKAGWDTHGLPVEIEVEKELGLESKPDIIKYGVKKFNEKCRESVFRYKKEWDYFTERIGFWLDLDEPYITYKNEYIETIWWILNQFWKKGLIYEGGKILPYCARCGTALSSHELSLGYEEVSDPSIYVKMKVKNRDNTSFLVWTTTPWTLISNVTLALNPDFSYVTVLHNGEKLILAKERLEILDGDYEILEEKKGKEFENTEYEQLFPFCEVDKKAFYVITGDFVSAEDGSGIVHIAPAFGEDDFHVGLEYDLPFLQPVDSQGKFTEEVINYRGKFVKDADPFIIEDLKQWGNLYKVEEIRHSYPHCWRCKSPLLYYAKRSWYIKTTAYKDKLIENNKKIKWYPKEVGEKRFGQWLENNVDWSLSRERFWGTPLNIWVCEECGAQESIGSIEELRKRSGKSPDEDIDLHKPDVDELYFDCPECKGKMKRVPDVIDVWFDSGSMPFAQWHYPFENKEKFEKQYPADFISEAIDQTRGWFYSLFAISTLLTGVSSFNSVIVMELILDKNGVKMSKSRGNAVEPQYVIKKYGADALRWYLITNSPPWIPTRFDEEEILEVQKKFFGTLLNIYSFFALYANIDEFTFGKEEVPYNERPILDRWLMSVLNRLIEKVNNYLEENDLTKAGREISQFVIDDLSNWYVRRSRRRFWKGEMEKDKTSAYLTLYESMVVVSKLLAPFMPFISEELFRNLTGEESVHLTEFPKKSFEPDDGLIRKMHVAREVAYFGRSIRSKVKIKIRQPLQKLLVVVKDGLSRDAVEEFKDVILEEVNVKEIEYVNDERKIIKKRVKPNFKELGPRLGKRMEDAAKFLGSISEKEIKRLEKGESIIFETDGEKYDMSLKDVEVIEDNLPGVEVMSEGGSTVGLDIRLTEELLSEGYAREFVNRVQNMRKEAQFNVEDRIRIFYESPQEFQSALESQKEYVSRETLALAINNKYEPGEFSKEVKIDTYTLKVGIERA